MAPSPRPWSKGCMARQRGPTFQIIMISDLEGYVSRTVKTLTGGRQKPMVAKPITVEDFPIAQRLR